MNLPDNFIALKNGKRIRIIATQKGKRLEIAAVYFSLAGSLYFNLTGAPMVSLQCGQSFFNQSDGKFEKSNPEQSYHNTAGFHLSIHPPPGNCVHIRSNDKNHVVQSVKNNWFPVTSPRNILHFWTASLDKLLESRKLKFFELPIPESHKGSIYGKLDLYPLGTKEFYPPSNSIIQIYGWSPLYIVFMSFVLVPPTEPHFIYPEVANQL